MTAPTHFLDLDQFDADTLRAMLKLGSDFKRGAVSEDQRRPLAGKTLAMIFEKPSTRTRVSFEVGMRQLGGDVVNLSNGASQLGRGETIADTARVLSRYCDAIMIRTDDPAKLRELALHATIPVINGLTDETHPCQVMADVMTFEEHRGSIAGKVVCWSGDGNNVAASWIQAAAHFGFEMRVACPENREPDAGVVQWARDRGASIVIGRDPQALAQGADCMVTDTWVSMHEEGANLHNLLRPYQVNAALMRAAKPDALFMHCLPCHREEEVTTEVIDGPQSVVWDEAENRLHAQKGILAWCLTRS
ncbi:MAG: ornithine carbamoyltransferase [Caenispirillum bisanense]|nr:ornithine carbamoyltransferase [Caenispirillum bisanense]MCA1972418.1 ornithine carbamoyltransferase [Caenispirillum sp.]